MTDDQELRVKALEIAARAANGFDVVRTAEEFYHFLKHGFQQQQKMAADAQKLAAKVREWDGASV